MVFSGFGHKPGELGGYSTDVMAELTAFAVQIVLRFNPTKIISGMSLGWEQALAMAAIELGVPLVAALAFKGQESVWPDKTQAFYQTLLNRATKIKIVTPGGFDPKKFTKRDHWIIDNCESLLVLCKDQDENLAGKDDLIIKQKNSSWLINRTLEYAKIQERRIYQLWLDWELWTGDVKFDNFRDSMLDISLFEEK